MFLYNWREQLIYAASAIITQLVNSGRNPKKLLFENILFIKDDEIGDLCYSIPVFAMMKKQFPNAKTTLLCKPFAKALVIADPNLDQVITDWSELTGKYDLLIELRGTWKSNGYALKYLPKFRLDRGSVKLRNKFSGKRLHETEINFKIIESLIDEENKTLIPVLFHRKEDEQEANQFLLTNGLNRFAVMHTSTRRELKKWPVERFRSTAIYLKEKYQLDIIFIGDKNDVEDIKKIQTTIPFPTFSTAGVLSLSAFGALVKNAAIYIGNDSGPLHIAALNGTPCIGLYGPVAPDVFYPPVKNAVVLHKVLLCNPCNQINCVHPENPCIQRISFDEVKESIDKLLVNESLTNDRNSEISRN